MRLSPSAQATSMVLGSTKRPDPMTSSAPLSSYKSSCTSTRSLTILRLRLRTARILILQLFLVMPNSSLLRKYEATFALWMTFLVGRHAMFLEPSTYFRSMATVFIPSLARVQEMSLPPVPLPNTRRSYSSRFKGREVRARCRKVVALFLSPKV